MGRTDFSDQFRKIIICYKRIGYNLNIMQQFACLVINPITIDSFAALFNFTSVDRASDSRMALTESYSLVGWGQSSFVCCSVHWGSTGDTRSLQISSGVV